MRDSLPQTPRRRESAIINLDRQAGLGTHWVAYKKYNSKVIYFDSFGALKPPVELLRYFGGKCKIRFNYDSYQKFNTINCGHLCLEFLYKNDDIL